MEQLVERIVNGYRFGSVEALLSVAEQMEQEALYEACHRITRTLCGSGFDTCSIINVKSGLCPEDCKWCAQSGHYSTNCEEYAVLPREQVVAQAKHNREAGIGRFSLVASGKRPTKREVAEYVALYKDIREAGNNIHLCASLGLATEEALRTLYEAGCTTYHCNMEAAPSFFGTLCSTHTQADKEATLRAAQRVGMRLCSGGIIGMGESRAQRAELALYLHSLGVRSIPINVLHPIPGTPLGNRIPLPEEEVLLGFALFRLANPTAFLRFSGGRALLSTATQRKALYIGINSAITGDLLTTRASVTERDMRLFAEMGYDMDKQTDWQ